ncbi:MAG: DUF6883 domain-containing protein [Bryobacterales bacterium]
MKLPGGERAVVDVEKLRTYCLDRSHLRGRHKARVFAAALAFDQRDAEYLRESLLAAARENEATKGYSDEYGDRHTIDFELERGERSATIRSA